MSTKITAGNETAQPTFTGDSDGSFAIRVGLTGSEQDAVQVSAAGDVTLTSGKLKHGTVSFQKMQLFAAKATTSGTFVDFTGIPSWATKITLMLNGVSNAGSNLFVQIGTSSTLELTGYIGAASSGTSVAINQTTGWVIDSNQVGAASYYGICTISKISGDSWVCSGSTGGNAAGTVYVGSVFSGSKTLSGAIGRLRLTSIAGNSAFDAGSVSILVEGYE